MTLQNRVAPTGEILADPGRGLLMGNRGCLHGDDRRLGTSRWRSKLWICCLLDFRGFRRDPMPPGRWTALFFLDEATALAAGHRPCAYCRRDAFRSYAESWRRAHELPARPRAATIDATLHAERVEARTRRQRTRPATLAELPDGAMVRYDGEPALVLGDCVLRWSFTGYRQPVAVPRSRTLEVFTPPSSLATLASGYQPILHPSVRDITG